MTNEDLMMIIVFSVNSDFVNKTIDAALTDDLVTDRLAVAGKRSGSVRNVSVMV